MSYTPLNVFVYASAQAGAMSGMQMPGSAVLFKATSPDYAILAATAGAFAQEFDTQWGASPTPNIYDAQVISDACAHLWASRTTLPQTDIFGRVLVLFDTPATYAKEVAALIAMIQAGDAFNASQGTTLPAAGASGTSVLTTFVTSLSTTVATAAQETIFVSGYSAPYDGGQGYFIWDPVATFAANGGTIIAVTGVATGRWMRVYDVNIWVTWFGAKGDGTTDDSPAIQAAINAAPYGGTIFFPRLPGNTSTSQQYVVNETLTVDYFAGQIGLTFLGDSQASGSDGAWQVQLVGNMPTLSGTTASIASVSGNFVTLTNVVGLTSATKIGDMISVSGTGSTDANGQLVNNSHSTIASVDVGAQSLTYYGLNPQAGFANGFPIAPDANNGAIHWTISKSLIKVTSEYITFRNISLFGHSGIGYVIYSTVPVGGGGGNTQLAFEEANVVGGIIGLTIGDIPSDYGTTGAYPVGNCEFYSFYRTFFDSQTFAGIKNNIGGEQKGHDFRLTAFQSQPYGIWLWSGSFNCSGSGLIFEANTAANFLLYSPVDTMELNGIQSENSARLFVTGTGPSGDATTPYSLKISNVRFDTSPGALAADGFVGNWIFCGGLVLEDCEFSVGNSGFTNMAIGITGIGNQLPGLCAARIISCGFPNNNATVVRAGSGLGGQGTFWYSFNNYCQDGTDPVFAVADGFHTLGALAAVRSNPFQLTTLTTPVNPLIIPNTADYELPNAGMVNVELTGGGGSATIAGMVALQADQLRTLTNLTGNPFTLLNESSGEVTATNRFHNPAGTDCVVTMSANLRYSASISRWVILSYQ
jgi:hypothetical protein